MNSLLDMPFTQLVTYTFNLLKILPKLFVLYPMKEYIDH